MYICIYLPTIHGNLCLSKYIHICVCMFTAPRTNIHTTVWTNVLDLYKCCCCRSVMRLTFGTTLPTPASLPAYLDAANIIQMCVRLCECACLAVSRLLSVCPHLSRKFYVCRSARAFLFFSFFFLHIFLRFRRLALLTIACTYIYVCT